MKFEEFVAKLHRLQTLNDNEWKPRTDAELEVNEVMENKQVSSQPPKDKLQRFAIMISEPTPAILANKGDWVLYSDAQKLLDAKDREIMSLRGNLGHPVPNGVRLPETADNVIAEFIAKERDQLKTENRRLRDALEDVFVISSTNETSEQNDERIMRSVKQALSDGKGE